MILADARPFAVISGDGGHCTVAAIHIGWKVYDKGNGKETESTDGIVWSLHVFEETNFGWFGRQPISPNRE